MGGRHQELHKSRLVTRRLKILKNNTLAKDKMKAILNGSNFEVDMVCKLVSSAVLFLYVIHKITHC